MFRLFLCPKKHKTIGNIYRNTHDQIRLWCPKCKAGRRLTHVEKLFIDMKHYKTKTVLSLLTKIENALIAPLRYLRSKVS